MRPYYDEDGITIYHGDCREVLPTIAADAVVTDPPFNVGKDYEVHKDALPTVEYGDLLLAVAGCGVHRQGWVTPTKHLALFASTLGAEAMPVVVRRGANGPIRGGWLDQFLMLLVRGKPARIVANLWTDIRLPDEGYYFREDSYGHPGYTPLAVMCRMVQLLAEPGQIVLEPFMGTGTALVAAKSHGCRAIGCEVNERYCEIAARRLAQGVLFGGAAL